MPRIFDNIGTAFAPALVETLKSSVRADFCVGYFNLRGWSKVSSQVDNWGNSEENCCRILIGMQTLPHNELKFLLHGDEYSQRIDRPKAQRLRHKILNQFSEQLTFGTPSNNDEATLRKLVAQLKNGQVKIKLFLRHQLHAKLYLAYRNDFNNPATAFLGSSNLTFSGLQKQGELNTDILDQDATNKLSTWFQRFWDDQFCIDVTEDLINIIEHSWARESPIPPFHIYLKTAWHLSREARVGIDEFRLTKDFEEQLLNFQKDAVKVAAQYMNTRGGVMIGDVVGLGKTMMATALAKMFEKDTGLRTLILCPASLKDMWKGYLERYHLHGRVQSTSQLGYLADRPKYGVVIIDESLNLMNRKGRRYKEIEAFIKEIDCKVILLSATPYNKQLSDLGNQLRLFHYALAELPVCPEKYLKEIGEGIFASRFQVPSHSLAAFEKSPHFDDWRELMRLFLVRRTRDFIKRNYATFDEAKNRHFITLPNGTKNYFPVRKPVTVKYELDENDPDDILAKMYSDDVVDTINHLTLPRYGLSKYLKPEEKEVRTPTEKAQIEDLSRAGKRLLGFCRTNLFKRLESSGHAFLLSVKRHIVRNYMFMHALENDLPLPVKTDGLNLDAIEETDEGELPFTNQEAVIDEAWLREQGKRAFIDYYSRNKTRRPWLRADLFESNLARDLEDDAAHLFDIYRMFSSWSQENDRKISELKRLLDGPCKNKKVLIFSQFSDTVRYVKSALQTDGIKNVDSVTGQTSNIIGKVQRFSPNSNDAKAPEIPIDILITTDVLSEGQNLQDANIVINYDLPWAIIRLIQRAGRVDRIGQKADTIYCYSFLPNEGVERIIRLRNRVLHRLHENAQVVGTDERFFDDEDEIILLKDIYSEREGVFDDDDDNEVDPVSHAYEIWNLATKDDPELKKTIEDLPDVIFSTKSAKNSRSSGVITYLKTKGGNAILAFRDKDGNPLSDSPRKILEEMACGPDTPALEKMNEHHSIVSSTLKLAANEQKFLAGNLGRPGSVRRRIYERVKAYIEDNSGTLLIGAELPKALEDIYLNPMTDRATESLGRQMRLGANDVDLSEMVLRFYDNDQLVVKRDNTLGALDVPQIICSMGIKG